MRSGFTLPELTVVLALVATGSSLALPTMRAQMDALATNSAREAAARALSRARAEAPLRGGALVELVEPGEIRLIAEERVLDVIDMEERLGVVMEIAGASSAAEIRYDALGVGRLANRTLHFRRGRAEATLVVSAYGRVTRR
jgi:prepilin-type N-terminal cleavage/methylation domain-containing protein